MACVVLLAALSIVSSKKRHDVGVARGSMSGHSGLLTGEPMSLWRCAATTAAAAQLPPFLLYMLGAGAGQGSAMGQRMLEFVADGDIGDVYQVAESRTPRPALAGPVGTRSCHIVRQLNWTDFPITSGGGHYSARWCMEKLELLAHLPVEVETVVLLDADTFVLREGASVFREQLSLLSETQFLVAPRTDARMTVPPAGTSGARRLRIPARSEGINSGVLGVHVGRMRRFEAAFCPGRSWWRCVLEAAEKGYHGVGGDQAVWNELIVHRPSVWRQLPCGTHLSIDVLRGVIVRLAAEVT